MQRLVLVFAVSVLLAVTVRWAPGSSLAEFLQMLLGAMSCWAGWYYWRHVRPLRASMGLRPVASGWLSLGGAFAVGALLATLLSAFVVAPMRSIGTSMSPTVLDGDRAVVWRSAYGVPHPFGPGYFGTATAQRGDVVSLRYRDRANLHKRVIGIAGDTVEVLPTGILLNGKPLTTGSVLPVAQVAGLPATPDGHPMPGGGDLGLSAQSRFVAEALGDHRYYTLTTVPLAEEPAPHPKTMGRPERFPCTYKAPALRCTIPPGAIFVMGDNRSVSLDSRQLGVAFMSEVKGRTVVRLSPTDSLVEASRL